MLEEIQKESIEKETIGEENIGEKLDDEDKNKSDEDNDEDNNEDNDEYNANIPNLNIDYQPDSEQESEDEEDEDDKKDEKDKEGKVEEDSIDLYNTFIEKTLDQKLNINDGAGINDGDESTDTGDDTDDEDYLKKLENNKDKIIAMHKEMFNINYNTIEKLCNIKRDENNNIDDPLHRTTAILTKYEKTKILGSRIKQINRGCKPFISISEDIIDGEIIAELELQAKKIPFIIKRPISNNKFEYWKLEDLEII